ncbi:MAG: hypothetical protein IPL61_04775 [Myxococcales bacterium]|nr:hypothetical protein [Myxococcales bacterium]
MMTPETRDRLTRHYGYGKGALKKLGPLTAADKAACTAEGYPPRAATTLTHDAAVARLLAAAAELKPEDVTSAFIAGVGGSWVRGRQPLLSYAHARHLKRHAADPTPGYAHCRTCGFERTARVDFTEQALRSHLGHVWNEGHDGYVADLEDFARGPRPAPTRADRAVLKEVLATAARAGRLHAGPAREAPRRGQGDPDERQVPAVRHPRGLGRRGRAPERGHHSVLGSPGDPDRAVGREQARPERPSIGHHLAVRWLVRRPRRRLEARQGAVRRQPPTRVTAARSSAWWVGLRRTEPPGRRWAAEVCAPAGLKIVP